MGTSAWPDLAAARNDLRRFLNDGPQDRFVKQKNVVGVVDGVNTTFFAFEDRVVPGALTVYVNSVALPDAQVNLVEPVEGKFTITPAPAAQSTLRASYFFQYFLDTDLDESTQLAAGEIIENDDITLIPVGLKGATLNFGGYFGYSKQAIRWATRKSAQFLLEEEPIQQEPINRSNLFQQLADMFYKKGVEMRTSFYTRHGRRNAPAFAVFKPSIPPIAPRR